VRFKNALHEGYSDLNAFERSFAEAIDRTRRVWCRNPPQGGFTIPLLDRGTTRNFSPDFLVWVDGQVVAIDTKGDHLITEDAGRKLFFIDAIEDGLELVIRLVTKGEWHASGTGEYGSISGSAGFSVWMLRQGKPHLLHCANIAAAIELCLRTTDSGTAVGLSREVERPVYPFSGRGLDAGHSDEGGLAATAICRGRCRSKGQRRARALENAGNLANVG
jgi:hypothetical protein